MKKGTDGRGCDGRDKGRKEEREGERRWENRGKVKSVVGEDGGGTRSNSSIL